MKENPFWKTKPLAEMTPDEWESLCDGCGRCCVEKLENRKTGKVYFTNVACKFLDINSCRCISYERRKQLAPWCMTLTPEKLPKARWLPKTCAYRLIAEGKRLPGWHPLVSGQAPGVHDAGVSVRGKLISSEYVHPDDLHNFIVNWDIWGELGANLD